MIASVVDYIMAFFEALTTSGAFKFFANLLLGIMLVYITIWLVIGGMKVASGQQKATDLFLNVGKFIGAYIIIFYVVNGGYVKDFLELNRSGINLLSKSGDSILGSLASPIRQYADNITFSSISAQKKKGIIYDSVTDASIDDTVKKFKADKRAAFKQELETALEELNQGRQARLAYCAANNIKSCSTAYYDELISKKKEDEKYFNSLEYKETLDTAGEKLRTLLLKKEEMPFVLAIGLVMANVVYIFFGLLFIIACVVILIPLWFKIFELALNFGVSLCLLIATIPIAAICLIYGKWFKDIFKAWFNRALSNFIQVPILGLIVNFLVSGVGSFPPVLGFSAPGSVAQIVKGAVMGNSDEIFSMSSFLYRIGCVLFLLVFCLIVVKLLDIVQKFLDDLVGSGFNATGGAISTLGGYVAGAATGIAATAGKLASGGLLAGANVVTRGLVNKVGSKIGNGISSMASVPSKISKAADSSIGRFTGATGRQQKAMKDEARKAAEFDREKDLQLRAMRAKDKVKK